MLKKGYQRMPKGLSKHEMLFEEIISKYHPDIVGNESVIDFCKKNIKWLNIERMIEETMAAVGGYDFVDQPHYDFTDGTDSKTASVAPNSRTYYGKETSSYSCEIGGIGNIGENSSVKTGALRVIVYNPHTQELEYYFIPNKDMKKLMRWHASGYRITTTWNINKQTNNKLDPYRVKDFETLATWPADKTKEDFRNAALKYLSTATPLVSFQLTKKQQQQMFGNVKAA